MPEIVTRAMTFHVLVRGDLWIMIMSTPEFLYHRELHRLRRENSDLREENSDLKEEVCENHININLIKSFFLRLRISRPERRTWRNTSASWRNSRR